MTSISLQGLTKTYGKEGAVHEVNLEIHAGEFVVFVGPSGCGKSTLLRMISGLEELSSGKIYFGERDVTQLPASKREVAMVFQAYALYPHMSAAQNLSFGLKMTGHAPEEIEQRLRRAVKMLRLDDYLARKPAQLSGGQCQRVAIGRALVQQPQVFLFDEPLSNLDAELRASMRVEIAKLHRELDNTMIYVTHDQVEAMTLADRIVVLNRGRIEQVGTPHEIYSQPENIFVAEFMGMPKINIVSATVVKNDGQSLLCCEIGLKIPLGALPCTVKHGEKIAIGIRPEDVAIAPDSDLKMAVDFIEQIGASAHLFGHINTEEFRITIHEHCEIAAGDEIQIVLNEEKIHFFDSAGRRIAVHRNTTKEPDAAEDERLRAPAGLS